VRYYPYQSSLQPLLKSGLFHTKTRTTPLTIWPIDGHSAKITIHNKYQDDLMPTFFGVVKTSCSVLLMLRKKQDEHYVTGISIETGTILFENHTDLSPQQLSDSPIRAVESWIDLHNNLEELKNPTSHGLLTTAISYNPGAPCFTRN